MLDILVQAFYQICYLQIFFLTVYGLSTHSLQEKLCIEVQSIRLFFYGLWFCCFKKWKYLPNPKLEEDFLNVFFHVIHNFRFYDPFWVNACGANYYWSSFLIFVFTKKIIFFQYHLLKTLSFPHYWKSVIHVSENLFLNSPFCYISLFSVYIGLLLLYYKY